jgi:hypothetical protein
MKKRPRTLTSFYSPTLMSVTPTVQPDLNLNLERTGATTTSTNVAEEITIEPEPATEVVRDEGDASQQQETPTSEQVFGIVADTGLGNQSMNMMSTLETMLEESTC